MNDLTQQGVYLDDRREEFADFIPPSARRAVDIGCGKGGFGRTLRQRLGLNAWIGGIESVDAQAEAARAGHGFDAVVSGYFPEAMPGDWKDLDLICFMDVLEHVYDPWATLSACRDVLAEDGRVLASIPNIQHLPVLLDLARGRWEYDDTGTLDRTHVRFFTRRSIIEMFNRAGFEVERIEGVGDVLADPRFGRWRPAARLLGDLRYVHMVVVGRKVASQSPNASILRPIAMSEAEETMVDRQAEATMAAQRKRDSVMAATLSRLRHLAAVEAKFRLGIPTELACDYASWRARSSNTETFSAPTVVSGVPGARIAVVLHVFYPELLEHLLPQLDAIDEPFDLFVTNASGQPLDQFSTAAASVSVMDVENRGRDVWPFLQVVQSGALGGYEAVVKLHTKKSPEHVSEFLGAADGAAWRTLLVDSLLATSEQFHRAFSAVTTGSGGLACHAGSVAGPEAWGKDRLPVRHLARRLDIPCKRSRLQFPAGSIFIMRGSLVEDLKQLRMTALDFEDEDSGWHTTTAHAIERLIGYVAQSRGLGVVGLEITSPGTRS